jgi:glucokinase
MKAFVDKGRYASLLRSIPVRIILNETVGLLGAARHAFDALSPR